MFLYLLVCACHVVVAGRCEASALKLAKVQQSLKSAVCVSCDSSGLDDKKALEEFSQKDQLFYSKLPGQGELAQPDTKKLSARTVILSRKSKPHLFKFSGLSPPV